MSTARRPLPAKLINSMFALTLAMVAYLGAIGFGTVWMRHRISVSANASRTLEQQIAELQRQVNDLNDEINFLQLPQQLMQQNQRMGLYLVQPREQQVIRVTEDVERRLTAKTFNMLYSSADLRPGPNLEP